MKNIRIILPLLLLACSLGSCQKMREKVNLSGVLIANTEVEDRVEMSYKYYLDYKDNYRVRTVEASEYSFLVGADSHVTTDPGRMTEMLNIGLEHEDLLYAHLGDIADTKADYYIRLDSIIEEGKRRYVDKYYYPVNEYLYARIDDSLAAPILYDKIEFPFYAAVGNHDITRNGWALWSNIFHSSFYTVYVFVFTDDGDFQIDRFIFLDSANGTLGRLQIDLIEEDVFDGIVDGENVFRHTFVFTHTNIFHPQFNEFASTFTREETFFLLEQFDKWDVDCVFCGHVHTWDDRTYNGVTYLTLNTMCEANNPNPGDYLVRMHVKSDGSLEWEQVHMDYTK